MAGAHIVLGSIHSGDFFWQTYLDASKAEDEARPKNWEGSTTGILTFTGLFAATVAAFIVESYKLLSPDSGERTNVLLEQILVAMANTSSQNPITVPPPDPFSPPTLAVVTNAFWFSSLLIALVCALLSTLVQEWSRHYVQDINRREVLHESLRERAFNHIYIRMGVNRYGMDQFVSWIVALVHMSVFLFACGLLVFLFPIHHVVAAISTGILGSFVAIYLVASVLPLLERSCPYRTPVTYLMAFIYWLAWHSWTSRHDKPMTVLYNLTTRRYMGFPTDFVTPKRHWFVWEHTVVHIPYQSSRDYFKALVSIINSGTLDSARDVILNRLCADFDLLYRLHAYLAGPYFETRTESLAIEPETFQLVALLFNQWLAMDVGHHSEPPHDTVYIMSSFMSIIGHISRIAQVDGPTLSKCVRKEDPGSYCRGSNKFWLWNLTPRYRAHSKCRSSSLGCWFVSRDLSSMGAYRRVEPVACTRRQLL
ncbi:hypothetical protein PENSPDRAFT_486002 [Peniophora sp. CONT]|nr:hypothetical protein PENSPDRAFT_486002 [Peniophora sp. CONT]